MKARRRNSGTFFVVVYSKYTVNYSGCSALNFNDVDYKVGKLFFSNPIRFPVEGSPAIAVESLGSKVNKYEKRKLFRELLVFSTK